MLNKEGRCKKVQQLAIKNDPESLEHFSKTKIIGEYYFDLPGYLLLSLKKLGLMKVCWTGHDTFVFPKKFFSHRYESIINNNLTGRLIGIIGIK